MLNWDSRPNSISKNVFSICKVMRDLNKQENPMQVKYNMVVKEATLKRVNS
jgi:hypothetical protein